MTPGPCADPGTGWLTTAWVGFLSLDLILPLKFVECRSSCASAIFDVTYSEHVRRESGQATSSKTKPDPTELLQDEIKSEFISGCCTKRARNSYPENYVGGGHCQALNAQYLSLNYDD